MAICELTNDIGIVVDHAVEVLLQQAPPRGGVVGAGSQAIVFVSDATDPVANAARLVALPSAERSLEAIGSTFERLQYLLSVPLQWPRNLQEILRRVETLRLFLDVTATLSSNTHGLIYPGG